MTAYKVMALGLSGESCTVISWPGESCTVISWPGESCTVISWPRESCTVISWPGESCTVISLPGESCTVISWPGESCTVISWPRESCTVISWPGESYTVISWPGESCTHALLHVQVIMTAAHQCCRYNYNSRRLLYKVIKHESEMSRRNVKKICQRRYLKEDMSKKVHKPNYCSLTFQDFVSLHKSRMSADMSVDRTR